MIDYGQKNKIILLHGGLGILDRLVDFWETTHKNVLYIHGDDSGGAKCKSILANKYTFEFVESKILENLFRLDLILVRNNCYIGQIMNLIDTRIGLPAFYVFENSNEWHLGVHSWDSQYQFERVSTPSIEITSRDYIIKDLKNGWSDSFNNLQNRWIRDKKLDDLFDGES